MKHGKYKLTAVEAEKAPKKKKAAKKRAPKKKASIEAGSELSATSGSSGGPVAAAVLVLALALVRAHLWSSDSPEASSSASSAASAASDAAGAGAGPRPPDGPELQAPTPLMRAAMMGDAAMMQELLAAPASRRGSVNAAVTGGITALHFALNGRLNQMQDDALVRNLQGDHETCVKLLLDADADPMVGHLSALWYAASFRNYEILALTARAGADTNDRADGGWSLLHEVSASKASGMARFFMKPEIDAQLLRLMRLQPLQPLSLPAASGDGGGENYGGGNGAGGVDTSEQEDRTAEVEAYSLPRLQSACQSDDLVLLIEQGAVVDFQVQRKRIVMVFLCVFLCPLFTQCINDHFTKTGSGHTYLIGATHSNKEDPFSFFV